VKRINISPTGFDYVPPENRRPGDIPFSGFHTFGKTPKHLEWCRDNSAPGGKMYVDGWVMHAHNEAIYPKYGWLTEPRSITPELYQWLDSNIDFVINTFDKFVVSDTRYLSFSPKFVWSPIGGSWVHDKGIHKKSKMISMICSNKNMCLGHKKRLMWRDRLQGNVDIFGKGFNPVDKKEDALNDYMFSVVLENEECPGYFTEKIIDCFLTGTIPIYVGAPNIGRFFNMDGIFLLEEHKVELSKELYAERMDAIEENYRLALNYEIIEDWIYHQCFKDS